jgi:hypothetical protein
MPTNLTVYTGCLLHMISYCFQQRTSTMSKVPSWLLRTCGMFGAGCGAVSRAFSASAYCPAADAMLTFQSCISTREYCLQGGVRHEDSALLTRQCDEGSGTHTLCTWHAARVVQERICGALELRVQRALRQEGSRRGRRQLLRPLDRCVRRDGLSIRGHLRTEQPCAGTMT